MKAYNILLLLIVAMLCFQCENEEELDTSTKVDTINSQKYLEKEFVMDVLKVAYYWNDKIPTINLADTALDAQDVINKASYTLDRWSFVLKTTVADDLFDNASYFGLGAKFLALNSKIYIKTVYKESDFYKNGITNRGWRVTQINGNKVTEYNFEKLASSDTLSKAFTMDSLGLKTLTVNIQPKKMKINTVIYSDIFIANGIKVGYFVFDQFLDPSKQELNELFAKFNSLGVTKLIVDLRYNGGGRVNVAHDLCCLIGGNNLNQKVFADYKYNSNLSNLAGTSYYKISQISNILNCSEVIFLTSKCTASASEMVIEGLKNYIPHKIFGEYTNGKPAGMDCFESRYCYDFTKISGYFTTLAAKNEKYKNIGISVFPITFLTGNYFNGIAPTTLVIDDNLTPLGNPQEILLRAALNYLKGVSSTSTKKSLLIPDATELYYEKGIHRATNGAL